LRAQVKAFLDHIQAPTVKATFEVSGKPDDVASVAIQNTDIKVLGVHAASFNVLDARVAYQFDVDVESEGPTIESCGYEGGRAGQRVERTFKLIWTIEIEIEPGIGGTFEIEEVEIAIEAPCCCPQTEVEEVAEVEEEPEDEEQDRGGGGKKKSGKKKRKGRD
jgi:hypothetical protein